jgi:selenocysteine lyase/cysteine desulfurase
LHCAPSAHKTIGTFPEGTIRLAPGIFTSPEDIRTVIAAFEKAADPHG